MERIFISEKYADNGGSVHFNGATGCDYTLCGLTLGGDSSIGIGVEKYVSDPVTCESCLSIVNLCKSQRLKKLEKR